MDAEEADLFRDDRPRHNLSSPCTAVALWLDGMGIHVAFFDSHPDGRAVAKLSEARYIHSLNPYMALRLAEDLVHNAMAVLRNDGPLAGMTGAPEPLDPYTRHRLYPEIMAAMGLPVDPATGRPLGNSEAEPPPRKAADDPNFNQDFWGKQLGDLPPLDDGPSAS